ncbi:MAG: GGDEF domain-containing protein [Thermoleophilaceae bacterium]|nr:GGDEF domain-containing protein [Thermoleophilaceae bacterium]
MRTTSDARDALAHVVPREDAPQTSGLTSRLILTYVEREGGRRAVEEMLERCGLEGREADLRDESFWFSYETKLALFRAAGEVLGDPDPAFHIGAAALELNIGAGLKLALRALGSPALVYRNVPRAAAKFTWTHRWEVLGVSGGVARLRFVDVAGVGYDAIDCRYNVGLLACVPALFGLEPAHVSHRECVVKGHERCVYEARWKETGASIRRVLALGALAAAAAGAASVLVSPEFVAGVVGAPAVAAGYLARRARRRLAVRIASLESQVGEQRDVAARLAGSLHDMVSDPRVEKVLPKITRNAQYAVGGTEFALLVSDGESFRCRASSGLPPETIAVLERWAEGAGQRLHGPIIEDDLAADPVLAELARHPRMPLGSLCAAPLVVGNERLGVLVALAHGPEVFLPEDAALLESYAAQAAIALANARMVDRLETLARTDPLTGLLNHREFHEAVTREIERAERYGATFSVVLLDLDRFKQVNDDYGHAAGDRVLCEVAEAIKGACRASDVASRLGGDEFGLVLPQSSAEDARAVARRIAEAVASGDSWVGVSAGVAEWGADGRTKEALLEHADMALYAQKPGRAQHAR